MSDLSFRNVQNRCARVDLAAERPTIDLSDVTWFEPYALIYLGMFLRHHNRQKRFFEVIQPRDAQARDYLTRQNFWERFRFTPDPETDRARLRFLTGTSFNDIVDLVNREDMVEEVQDRLLGLLQGQPVGVNTREVTEATVELIDNFAQHAEEGLAAMTVQWYPNKKEVRIALGDCGIGIRQSLVQSGRYPSLEGIAHKDAVFEAFKEKVTRKHEGGMGLEFVRDIIERNQAEMFISSFDGAVYVKHGTMYPLDVPHSLAGVQVEMCFIGRR